MSARRPQSLLLGGNLGFMDAGLPRTNALGPGTLLAELEERLVRQRFCGWIVGLGRIDRVYILTFLQRSC